MTRVRPSRVSAGGGAVPSARVRTGWAALGRSAAPRPIAAGASGAAGGHSAAGRLAEMGGGGRGFRSFPLSHVGTLPASFLPRSPRSPHA
jgi:hypothetical protein